MTHVKTSNDTHRTELASLEARRSLYDDLSAALSPPEIMQVFIRALGHNDSALFQIAVPKQGVVYAVDETRMWAAGVIGEGQTAREALDGVLKTIGVEVLSDDLAPLRASIYFRIATRTAKHVAVSPFTVETHDDADGLRFTVLDAREHPVFTLSEEEMRSAGLIGEAQTPHEALSTILETAGLALREDISPAQDVHVDEAYSQP